MLTATERAHSASEADQRHADRHAWSTGNLVRPPIDGAEHFLRLRDELRDCRTGDQGDFVSWRDDPAERLDGPGTAIAVELARAVSSGTHCHVYGANLGVRANVFQAVGGFPRRPPATTTACGCG